MDMLRPMRLLPTLPMIAESLALAGWECRMVLADPDQSYRGVRLYHGQTELQRDVLYLLRPTEGAFPFDEYTWLSAGDHPGAANHLICPPRPDEELLDQLLEVFAQFQSWEDAIDLLLYRSAGLQELCELGSQLLENPVCIHDDWFVMMAATAEFTRIMEPEYLISSTRGFVPRAVVEDFQYDSDYLETYDQKGAAIWQPPGQGYASLYVNLWDGSVYKGRLLVAKQNREFLRRDFLLAEALTQRAVLLLRRKQPGDEDIHQNMDDVVFALLQGQQTGQPELAYLMNMLRWQESDRFQCLRLKPQSGTTVVLRHMLHSELFRLFPGSYVLLDGQEQCVVLDLTRSGADQVRHALAPICRDYCQYAGISAPVTGIRELHAAYFQAGAALDQAFRLRSDRWLVSFPECALDHVLRTLPPPLTARHLIAPELLRLMDHDRDHGTPYFETLRQYLLQERDIPRTAEALIIHRTTLLYRLKKLQSLLQTDLEDPNQRLRLLLSLWILEQESPDGSPL